MPPSTPAFGYLGIVWIDQPEALEPCLPYPLRFNPSQNPHGRYCCYLRTPSPAADVWCTSAQAPGLADQLRRLNTHSLSWERGAGITKSLSAIQSLPAVRAWSVRLYETTTSTHSVFSTDLASYYLEDPFLFILFDVSLFFLKTLAGFINGEPRWFYELMGGLLLSLHFFSAS